MAVAIHSRIQGEALRCSVLGRFRRVLVTLLILLMIILPAIIAPRVSAIKKQLSSKKAVSSLLTRSDEQLIQRYSKLPLSFEMNQGQVNGRVKFLSRGVGSGIYLTPNEVILNLRRPTQPGESRAASGDQNRQGVGKAAFQNENRGQSNLNSRDSVRMRLVGAYRKAKIEGVDELPGTVNYFIGKSSKNWHTNIQTYRKVAYRDVYPGIDQIYYGNEQQLEYDFIVSPGANPRSIILAFKGESDLTIDHQGDLVLHSQGAQEIRLHKPFVYQEINGEKREIPARYVMRAKRQAGFEIGGYDMRQPLIIDPVISYSTYLGGSGNDVGFGVALDNSGNAYITGSTDSSELSTLGGSNAFVAKLNAAGTQREYLSIIGGSGDDAGFDIAVDGAGNAYITGSTNTTDFPLVNAAQPTYGGGSQDAFVAKLNPTGSALVYSTYLGGSSNDAGFGIAVDGSGNAYVTGSTDSVEFSSLAGSNAFVAKFNAGGNQRTSLAVLGGSGDDVGFSVAVDASGSAYITGSTDSTNFTTANPLQPNVGGSQDAFIAKLNPTSSALIYSTYFGGSGSDAGFDIAVDSAGNAYVTGSTSSPEFSNLGGTDAFVVKLNAAGSERSYFAILGGSGDDVGFSIALDSSYNAFVTGSSNSTNFTTANPLQTNLGGSQDAFVAKLNSSGSSLSYSTFLGGEVNDAGFGITIDNQGTATITGFTNSSNFISLSALQSVNGGGGDAFIAKILDVGSPPPTPIPTLQLNQSNYNISEGTGSLNLLVNRTGDPSPPVTVNYSTSDGAAYLQNCNVLNGQATSRCDYVAVVGTLHFASGETSKTISIPVVDDTYAEGSENFFISLSNPAGGAILGALRSATVSISDNSNDGSGLANPIDNSIFFVREHYIDFLSREPDPASSGWVTQLNGCGAGDQSCRLEVSQGIYNSPEFKDRGYFIYKFFSVSLGRKPTYDEFNADRARVSGFQTEAELEQSKVDFITDFMGRAEFANAYNGLSNEAYVAKLFDTAGVTQITVAGGVVRTFSMERQLLVEGTISRTRVLRDIAESPEVSARFLIESTVVMHYFGYLRRDPDAAYQDWITILTTTGDSKNVTNGFVNSLEYKMRFSQ